MICQYTTGVINAMVLVSIEGSSDMTVNVWSFDEVSHLSVIQEGITSPVTCLALSTDNTFLVLGRQLNLNMYQAFELSI